MTFESAEGGTKVHAYEVGKKRTLCGLRLQGYSAGFPTAKPLGMEWFTPVELLAQGERACARCRRVVDTATRPAESPCCGCGTAVHLEQWPDSLDWVATETTGKIHRCSGGVRS